jgi:hypothetical protein
LKQKNKYLNSVNEIHAVLLRGVYITSSIYFDLFSKEDRLMMDKSTDRWKHAELGAKGRISETVVHCKIPLTLLYV